MDEGPSQVMVGDFDEDGILDLVGSLYFWSDEISLVQIFYGDKRKNRRGTFLPGPTFAGAPAPAGKNLRVTSVADFNGDGHLDVTVGYPGATWSGRHVEVYLGDGSGGMTLAQDLVGEVNSVLAADVNGDGFADLVGSNNGATVFLNQGNGMFGPSINSPMRSGQFIVPDLDGDGTPDFVTLTYGDFNEPWLVRTALGQGNGSFVVTGEYPIVENQYETSLVAADFDGDGFTDIVAGVNKTETFFLRGNGDGTVSDVRWYYAGGLYATAIHLDGDGRSDLVTGGINPSEVSLTLGGAQGLESAAVINTPGSASLAACGDINGDGRLDIVSGGASLFVMDGAARFLTQETFSLSRPARSIAVGDLNGDGCDDVVVGSLPSLGFNLEILLGSAIGQLTHFADLHNGSATAIYDRALALSDLNGDGALDIVTTTFATLSVLLNRGDATFQTPLMTGRGVGSVSNILIADFDADGTRDAVAVWDALDANNARSYVELNLGNGDGTFDYVQQVFIDGRVPKAVVARADSDNLPDVFVGAIPGTHSGAGGLYTLRNVGGALAIASQDTSSPIHQLGAGDFTGDGLVEIVLMHGANPFFQGLNLDVRVNDGSGGYGEVISLAAPRSPQALVIADLAGGGGLDFGILNAAGGGISTVILLENITGGPTGIPSRPTRPGVPAPTIKALYPNPFNPTTTIIYTLPVSSVVRLTIHDASGRRVATLSDRVQDAGDHRVFWHARADNGRAVASGVYFVRLEANGHVRTEKVVLLK